MYNDVILKAEKIKKEEFLSRFRIRNNNEYNSPCPRAYY